MTHRTIETDCRSEEGITVGLIDSLISISRVLSKRDFSSRAVQESLCDLFGDEDFNTILMSAPLISPEAAEIIGPFGSLRDTAPSVDPGSITVAVAQAL